MVFCKETELGSQALYTGLIKKRGRQLWDIGVFLRGELCRQERALESMNI